MCGPLAVPWTIGAIWEGPSVGRSRSRGLLTSAMIVERHASLNRVLGAIRVVPVEDEDCRPE
jgi:hypothetical protein